MQTIKTCKLDNDKQHVCFKDLENYWRKDEYLAGLSSIEMAQIRQNLGLPSQLEVDFQLDKQSKNPIQNRTVARELEKKPNIEALARVAFTGQYSDLRNFPITLPNPCPLLINLKNIQYLYDGLKPIQIDLNKLSQFENDLNFITKDVLDSEVTLKGIILNNKTLIPDCDKMVKINVPLKVSELVQDLPYITLLDAAQRFVSTETLSNYLTKTEAENKYLQYIDSVVSSLSDNAVSAKAVYTYCQTLIDRISGLESRITSLEARILALESNG